MRRRAGFTIIELLAVVAMFALVAAMVAPTFDLGGGRAVRREAEQLGSAFEMARQRAILTGRGHQVVIDLDAGEYWVEWEAPPDPEAEAAAAVAPAPGTATVPLVPPELAGGEVGLVPVPGPFGRPYRMEDPALILEVALPDARFDAGLVELRLGPDGATDPALIRVGDLDGQIRLDVEVAALADAVRVLDVE